MLECLMRPCVLASRVAAVVVCALSIGACDERSATPIATCETDRECADGELCNGLERCEAGICVDGAEVLCAIGDTCTGSGQCVAPCVGQCGQASPCALPRAPGVAFVSATTPLPVALSTADFAAASGPSASNLEAALTAAGVEPTVWFAVDGPDLALEDLGFNDDGTSVRRRLHLRSATRPASCETVTFVADYVIVPGTPDNPEPLNAATLEILRASQAEGRVLADDPRIKAWAVEVVSYAPGERVDPSWQDEQAALGPAGFDVYDILSLGEGGEAIFAFDAVFGDLAGPDLVVFENAVPDNFVEFGTVAVSTDGQTFAEFDTVSLTPEPIGTYSVMDARLVSGLAGSAPLGTGVSFDLASLAAHPAVVAGRVDLAAINFVRIRDLVGDGGTLDSFGRPIWDPFPTYGSAGFDVDAVGVLRPQ